MSDPTAAQVEAMLALEARINDLEAREHIEAMHAAFVRAVADRRFDSLAAYFTTDATIDMRAHGPRQGATAIAAHFEHMATAPLLGAGYILSSPIITVDGDQASAQWTWHRLHSSGEVAGHLVRVWGMWEEGRYDCRYRRQDDGWKFSYMRFRIVRPDPDPDGSPIPGEESP